MWRSELKLTPSILHGQSTWKKERKRKWRNSSKRGKRCLREKYGSDKKGSVRSVIKASFQVMCGTFIISNLGVKEAKTHYQTWWCYIPTVTVKFIAVTLLAHPIQGMGLLWLERSAAKVARSVLRRVGGGDPAHLSDNYPILFIYIFSSYFHSSNCL